MRFLGILFSVDRDEHRRAGDDGRQVSSGGLAAFTPTGALRSEQRRCLGPSRPLLATEQPDELMDLVLGRQMLRE